MSRCAPVRASWRTAVPLSSLGRTGWLIGGWFDRILPALGARACFLCLGPSRGAIICGRCERTLPRLRGHCCPRCAAPSDAASACPRCTAQAPSFDAVRAMYAYAYPVDRIIHALKYGHRLPLAAWCASRLSALADAEYARCADDVAVIPLPSSRDSVLRRGFDHAGEIARRLAPMIGARCRDRWVERIGRQPPQASLPWRERARNVEGVFRCVAAASPRSIVIVDDVMTTGASAESLARCLRAAGASRIEVWVLARTPRHRVRPRADDRGPCERPGGRGG